MASALNPHFPNLSFLSKQKRTAVKLANMQLAKVKWEKENASAVASQPSGPERDGRWFICTTEEESTRNFVLFVGYRLQQW